MMENHSAESDAAALQRVELAGLAAVGPQL
jgi:hypothetical protein